MVCPNAGDLYRLIDHNGEHRGYVVFIDMIAPWVLTKGETMTPGFWHYKVLREGSVQYIDTNNWTLIQAEAERRAIA